MWKKARRILFLIENDKCVLHHDLPRLCSVLLGEKMLVKYVTHKAWGLLISCFTIHPDIKSVDNHRTRIDALVLKCSSAWFSAVTLH